MYATCLLSLWVYLLYFCWGCLNVIVRSVTRIFTFLSFRSHRCRWCRTSDTSVGPHFIRSNHVLCTRTRTTLVYSIEMMLVKNCSNQNTSNSVWIDYTSSKQTWDVLALLLLAESSAAFVNSLLDSLVFFERVTLGDSETCMRVDRLSNSSVMYIGCHLSYVLQYGKHYLHITN